MKVYGCTFFKQQEPIFATICLRDYNGNLMYNGYGNWGEGDAPSGVFIRNEFFKSELLGALRE